jgi:hypothetical protein
LKRIFLPLAILSVLLLTASAVLGIMIDDPASLDPTVQWKVSSHMLLGLASLTFATMLHAILFTYFMGTGRWIEETAQAYRLSPDWHARNQRIKYRTLAGVMTCVGLIIATGALGAAADPASPVNLDGFAGMSGSTLHFAVAMVTIVANVAVHFSEFTAVSRNTLIVEGVLAEVRRMREERGLPVD